MHPHMPSPCPPASAVGEIGLLCVDFVSADVRTTAIHPLDLVWFDFHPDFPQQGSRGHHQGGEGEKCLPITVEGSP